MRYWAHLKICNCSTLKYEDAYITKKKDIFFHAVDLSIFQWDRPRRQGPSSNRCRLSCMTIFHLKKIYLWSRVMCRCLYILRKLFYHRGINEEGRHIRFAALWIDNVFLSRSYFNEKEFGILTDTLFVFKDLIAFSR